MAVEEGIDEYTQDGTVDLKGNPVLRSKRGGWTACWFVVGNFSLSLPLFSLSLKYTDSTLDFIITHKSNHNPLYMYTF
jgi:hypothetical protein